MHSTGRQIVISLLMAAGIFSAGAQELNSGVFGYCNVTFLGNSDNILSVPFARLPVASAQIASATGNLIQFQASQGWTTNQFTYVSGTQSNTYYARFDSGLLEGRAYTVTTNDAGSVAVNLGSDSLAAATSGDTVSIVPYWTFATIFPYTGNPTNWNGIHVSTSPGSQKTSVLVRQLNGIGKNLIPAATYYLFSNSTTTATWRRFPATTNNNDDIVPVNTHMMVRNNSVDATYVSFGDVLIKKTVMTQRVSATNQQDNYFGLPRPITVALNDLGLQTNVNFVQSPSSGLLRDQILTYDNTTTGKNKIPAGTYYYLTNAGWRKVSGGTTVDYGYSNIFQPVTGFILRKTTNSAAPVWTNAPTY
jgi:uncharacterized protein (TIGR02597 family)